MGFKYQYALTSVQFDSSYENAIRFDTRAQQEEYFKVSTLFANAKSVNFDFGNLINTTLVVKVKKAPMELMGYNYLILKDLNQNPTHRYVYFFIDKVEYISGGDNVSDTTIRLDLTMDVLNTYMLDIAWDNGALIERASLDRWDNINGYLYYNLKPDSPFRLDDEGEAKCSKVLINRENLQVLSSDYDISSVTSLYYDWINQYVQCWEYVFLDKNHSYTFKSPFQNTNANMDGQLYLLNYNMFSKEGVDTIPDYGLLAVPIYKDQNHKIRCHFKTGDKDIYIDVSHDGLSAFRALNNDASYFFGDKYGLMCPLHLEGITCSIVGDYLVIEGDPSTTNPVTNNAMFSKNYINCMQTENNDFDTHSYYFKGVFIGGRSFPDIPSKTAQYSGKGYYSPVISQFSLVNATSRYTRACPRLLSSNYSGVVVKCVGDELEYSWMDLSAKHDNKWDDGKFSLLYTEIIQPEITKYYVRIKAPYGVYIGDSNYNYSGLVSTADTSIAIVNSAYAEFLANNKNYWLMSFANALGGGVSGLLDAYHPAHPIETIETTTRDLKAKGGRFRSPTTGKFVGMDSPERPLVGTGFGRDVTKTITKPAWTDWTSVASYGVGVASNVLNSAFTIANVKASPSNMKNSTGNGYFTYYTTGFGLYVEAYSALDIDLDRCYQYHYMYGYKYGKFGNVNDFMNIRHYFNYVQADLQNITGKTGYNIPNQVRDEIKHIFGQGVRLWNVSDKMFDYDVENYERSLE